ncbi:CapA family protein [Candidatus Dojkabacteria bacterium]|nr:CapA family protein [Candidatus Dojkabacteria bacterium]
MAIKHSLTDKESRKVRNTTILYILGILLIIVLPFLLINQKPLPKEKEESKKEKLCIEGELQLQYTELLDKYAQENNMETILGEDTECLATVARNINNINEYIKITNKIYVIVGRYDTTLTDIPSTSLDTLLTTQKYKGTNIVWDNDTDTFLRTAFEGIGVGQRVIETDDITKEIEKNSNTLAIIPFEKITSTFKVISIDDQTPLNKDFNTLRYPLIDRYWIKGVQEIREKIASEITEVIPVSNYNANNLRKIVLTGSSAVGSGIQQSLYTNKGKDYITYDIQTIISSADIAQFNNEASISSPCIQSESTGKYCSTQSNLRLIKDLGFDVVGTNGNHIMDISYDTYVDTLAYYRKNNLPYYAGGVTLEDSWTPRVVDAKGLKFSFIGFNYLYPFSYYASKTTAGSANVDMDILKETITKAKKASNIVIVDMSWGFEYEEKLVAYQQEYAQKALEYGANIVIGTQSRIYQSIELYKNGNAIFYGLGAFLPHTYSNSQSAIYTLTYYNDTLINITINPIILNNGLVQLAESSQLDTMLKNVYSNIKIK